MQRPPLRPRVALLLALVASVLPEAATQAAPGQSKLARLAREAEGAGPHAFVALRELWQEWDQGDPSEVEAALSVVANAPEVRPPVRVYAGLLGAYARRRRGDLEATRSRVGELGYVSRWLVLGPFENEGKAGPGLPRDFGPEAETTPPEGSRSYPAAARPVKWRVAGDAAPFGWLDFGALLRPVENSCAYAETFVADDRLKEPASRAITLFAGSGGALRVFWNGEEVLRDKAYRSYDADRLATTVRLHAGQNRLLVKACGEAEAPLVGIRLADERGAPDPHLTTTSDLTKGADAFRGAKAIAPKKVAPTEVGPVLGPLQAFERLAKGKDPAVLEDFTRYLLLTQSDDPAAHEARELAVRAATLGPSIRRFLLAGSLAEGRNQRAAFLDKAEARVVPSTPEEEQMEVAIARADYVRAGADGRAALPLYEKILARDPDNVHANLARYELYDDVGLRDTARTALERAALRRPKSVALLRAMIGALRAEDRVAEAVLLEERYAALRFDDATFVGGKLDLAVARRDLKGVKHWGDRLEALDPGSQPALLHAARSYLLLGDRPRSIALYRKALDLAPEDTDTLLALADAYALTGERSAQTRLLQKVLELKPQAKEVREYLAHAETTKPRADEAYAAPPERFLKERSTPAGGFSRRELQSLTVTTVFPNGLASHFHQVVFQPLTEAAAAEAREYAFGFEADSEVVQLRGARVYRADGRIDEAAESGEGSADDPTLATYTSARAFYVHFPRLNAGDVVELRYRIEDVAARNAFADYFGEIDYLQRSEPVLHAEYVLVTPKSRTFYFNDPKVSGLRRETKEDAATRTYSFAADHVAPLTPEPSAPPLPELLGHVHVSTYKDWDEMGRWYWGLVHDQFVADDEVRKRVAEITKGAKTEAEKVRAVYDYVVQKTRYVALEFGIHGFLPYRAAQIFSRGFGDCKDKATLIVTMLKELGIPATIVIVRTGMKGLFETSPASLAPFDHAIAYVPSQDLYLDGTAEYTGSRELPAMDRGALALQINEGKPKLVHLPEAPPQESSSKVTIDLSLKADSGADLDWRATITGAGASGWRRRYHAGSSRKERISEDLGGDFPGLLPSLVEGGDFDDVESPAILHVKGKVPSFAEKEEDGFTLPTGRPNRLVREYAPLTARRLPLRIPSASVSDHEWTFHAPPGYSFARLPSPVTKTTPFGAYSVETEPQGPQAVRVRTSLTLAASRISAADYPAFRAFAIAADEALSQRILLRP